MFSMPPKDLLLQIILSLGYMNTCTLPRCYLTVWYRTLLCLYYHVTFYYLSTVYDCFVTATICRFVIEIWGCYGSATTCHLASAWEVSLYNDSFLVSFAAMLTWGPNIQVNMLCKRECRIMRGESLVLNFCSMNL